MRNFLPPFLTLNFFLLLHNQLTYVCWICILKFVYILVVWCKYICLICISVTVLKTLLFYSFFHSAFIFIIYSFLHVYPFLASNCSIVPHRKPTIIYFIEIPLGLDTLIDYISATTVTHWLFLERHWHCSQIFLVITGCEYVSGGLYCLTTSYIYFWSIGVGRCDLCHFCPGAWNCQFETLQSSSFPLHSGWRCSRWGAIPSDWVNPMSRVGLPNCDGLAVWTKTKPMLLQGRGLEVTTASSDLSWLIQSSEMPLLSPLWEYFWAI